MGVDEDWPEYTPDTSLTVVITSGQLTLSNSTLDNYDNYSWNPDEVHGAIWKNSTRVATLSIDSSDGSITLSSAISVSQGDLVEVRLQFVGNLSTPWYSKALLRRAAFVVVPAGNASYTFDSTHNTMPVPEWDMAFGWDSNGYLKVGFSVDDDDGASQDMTVYTRMLGSDSASQSSSTIDLGSSSLQTHTSTFTKGEIQAACEMEMWLRSAASGTRQESRSRIVLVKFDEVDSYPSNFPTTGAMLHQEEASGGNAAELSKV